MCFWAVVIFAWAVLIEPIKMVFTSNKKFPFVDDMNFLTIFKAFETLDKQNLPNYSLSKKLNEFLHQSKQNKHNILHALSILNFMHDKESIEKYMNYLIPYLSDPIHLNKQDISGDTPLILACNKESNIEYIRLLLAYRADATLTNDDDTTALSTCIQMSNYELIKLLISFDVDIYYTNTDGKCLLHDIFELDDVSIILECIQPLLNDPTYVNKCTNNGTTPLMFACMNNNYTYMKLLLHHGAVINIYDNNKENVMSYLCQNGDVPVNESIIILLTHSYDIYSVTAGNNNLLHTLAILEGESSILYTYIESLFTESCIVNAYNTNNETPLMLACQTGNIGYIKKLLMHNADVNKLDKHKQSALMYCDSTTLVEVFPLLLPQGLTTEGLYGDDTSDFLHTIACIDTPVTTASDFIDFIQPIFSGHNYDFDRLNRYGDSALLIACENKNIEYIQLLLSYGADMNLQDNEGMCALVCVYTLICMD